MSSLVDAGCSYAEYVRSLTRTYIIIYVMQERFVVNCAELDFAALRIFLDFRWVLVWLGVSGGREWIRS